MYFVFFTFVKSVCFDISVCISASCLQFRVFSHQKEFVTFCTKPFDSQ